MNGRDHDPIAVGPEWQTVECVTAEGNWHSGVNRVRLDFAWARRPADVGAGGDLRLLAAAIAYVRVAVTKP